MARRFDLDWEKIQRLYVAGQMTLKEISEECGNVSESSIRLKAKQQGWERNLGAAIKERAKAKIAQIDVQDLIEQSAAQSAAQSAETIKKAIEDAANVQAGVTIRHRREIRESFERANRLESALDEALIGGEEIELSDVMKATQDYKALVDAKSKLMELERKSYNMDDANTGESEDNSPVEIQVNLVGTNAKD